MSQREHFTVGIIGGGAAGSFAALQLLRELPSSARCVLIEGSERCGPGVAYGTSLDTLILNVPTGRMSPFVDEPEHFHRWVSRIIPQVDLKSFVPRKLFGNYLQELLKHALESDPRFSIVRDNVISLIPSDSQFSLNLQARSPITVDAAVLATGNFISALSPSICGDVTQHPRFYPNGWAFEQLQTIPKDASVTIVGTGLTMVDVVLSLTQFGHRGQITALSRHGHLPVRGVLSDGDVEYSPKPGQSLKAVLAEYRALRASGASNPVLFDVLRPRFAEIWLQFSDAEKRRFLRHLQSFWGNARHRMPEEVYQRLNVRLEDGTLKVRAARLLKIGARNEHLELTLRPRRSPTTETLAADYVICALGPEGNYRRVASPLLQSLIESGHAAQDALKLGLDATPDGRLRNRAGEAWENFFTLGNPLKGILWESTAVPTLREQAKALALRISERCRKQ